MEVNSNEDRDVKAKLSESIHELDVRIWEIQKLVELSEVDK